MTNNELLFVYGTLRNLEVQLEIIGRKIESSNDTLTGYKVDKVEIEGGLYPQAVRSENDGEEVQGLVLVLTDEELSKIDEYETEAYERNKVKLKSGKAAWLYERKK